jgi:hypothetical protein
MANKENKSQKNVKKEPVYKDIKEKRAAKKAKKEGK